MIFKKATLVPRLTPGVALDALQKLLPCGGMVVLASSLGPRAHFSPSGLDGWATTFFVEGLKAGVRT